MAVGAGIITALVIAGVAILALAGYGAYSYFSDDSEYHFPAPPANPPFNSDCITYTTKHDISLEVYNFKREVHYNCTECTIYIDDAWDWTSFQRTTWKAGPKVCNNCSIFVHVILRDPRGVGVYRVIDTQFVVHTTSADEWEKEWATTRRVTRLKERLTKVGNEDLDGLFTSSHHQVAIGGPGLRNVDTYDAQFFRRDEKLLVGQTWRNNFVFNHTDGKNKVSFSMDVHYANVEVMSSRTCNDDQNRNGG